MLASSDSERVLTETQDDSFSRLELAVPRRFFATTGISVREDGTSESEDLSLSAKHTLLNVIDHLETPGFDRPQAYALCIAWRWAFAQPDAVDVPNLLVGALLPLDIFV